MFYLGGKIANNKRKAIGFQEVHGREIREIKVGVHEVASASLRTSIKRKASSNHLEENHRGLKGYIDIDFPLKQITYLHDI